MQLYIYVQINLVLIDSLPLQRSLVINFGAANIDTLLTENRKHLMSSGRSFARQCLVLEWLSDQIEC